MKLRTRRSIVLAVGVLLGSWLMAGNCVFASDATLRVAVESHGADLVEVILTNESDHSLSVLNWGTPFESVMSHDVFDIYSADDLTRANLAYKGRSVKRGEPLPEDFFTLAAGESIQQFLSLSVYYAIPVQGAYTVEYNGSIVFQSPEIEQGVDYIGSNVGKQIKSTGLTEDTEKQLKSTSLASEAIRLELTPPLETGAARVPAFFSCTVPQQAGLLAALQATEEITNVARDGLAGLVGDARLNSPRYRNWFGEYSAARFDTVLETFEAASDVIANEQVEFDCRCDEAGLFAYVFPSDPYRIYPCPVFWSASVTGTDSRAGTLLHELTHFPAINGANDFQYGKTAVALLATTNPEQAVNNADSYEYFAENTPSLAISNLLVFTDITIGVSEVSELRTGESSFYKVTGADYVELISTTGDADLYVYATAAANQDPAVCQSLSADGVDRCDLNPSETAYIEIRGYEASQYTVLAQTNIPIFPVCASNDSDADGDGWGWENSQSCKSGRLDLPGIEPENPIVTPEGGSGATTGGNDGYQPVNDSADSESTGGGGGVGLSLILLAACRRRLYFLSARARDIR